MDNNFELVPLETKGATGWIYLYLRSFVGWILSFFDIYEIKSLIGSESRSKFLQLEEELTYRLRPVSISTPIKVKTNQSGYFI